MSNMPRSVLYRAFLYVLPLPVMISVVVTSMTFSRSPSRTLVTLSITAFSLYYITKTYILYFKFGVVEESPVRPLPGLRARTFCEVLVNSLFLVTLGGLLEQALIFLINDVYLSLAVSVVVLAAIVSVLKRARWKYKTTYMGMAVLVFFAMLYFAELINDRSVEHFEHACKLLEEVLYGA